MAKQVTVTPAQLAKMVGGQDEYAFETEAAEALGFLGYVALRTARHGKQSDKGVPDLLVSHVRWPFGVWAGIEVKKEDKGRLHGHQGILFRDKRIYVARTWDEVLWVVAQTEIELVLFPEGKATQEWRKAGCPTPERGRCLYG